MEIISFTILEAISLILLVFVWKYGYRIISILNILLNLYVVSQVFTDKSLTYVVTETNSTGAIIQTSTVTFGASILIFIPIILIIIAFLQLLSIKGA